jgi:tetratricopeptide (TPR) repeat protein
LRLERNPKDVDALINLGTHLEEQDQVNQAEALYERAIKARPDCNLGYYFSGLAEERISDNAATDAEVKIRKAISLDQSLQNDPNMQGFLKRHSAPMGGMPSKGTESPSGSKEFLASVNRFSLGVGVGLLLAAAFFYLSRRRLVTDAKSVAG